jgi:hypothetical protein
MIWQCADCGNQVVQSRRPAACRFCGPDVEFFVSGGQQLSIVGRSAGHPGALSGVAGSPPATTGAEPR